MNLIKSGIILLLVIQIPLSSYSQADFKPKASFRADVGLPSMLEVATNKGFRDLMQGMVNVAPAFQYTFDNTIAVGTGFRYTFFNVNEFKNNFEMTGNLHFLGVYGKIGREEYWDKLGVDYGIRVGYNVVLSNTNFCREIHGEPKMTDGGFVEPTFNMSYMINENQAFSYGFGYAFHSLRFSPQTVCVDDFPGISHNNLNARTSYLTFSFGYVFYF